MYGKELACCPDPSPLRVGWDVWPGGEARQYVCETCGRRADEVREFGPLSEIGDLLVPLDQVDRCDYGDYFHIRYWAWNESAEEDDSEVDA